MKLLSLSTAKTHLRIAGNDQDGDINAKVEEATEIILDYLKDRAHAPVTITSSSVASPTVITTDEAHGFSNGETVTIEGHDDSTPELFGEYVISNATEFTFTIPVAVTVAGSGGTATVLWTETTAPRPVISAVKLMLTNLYEHRGDDSRLDEANWKAIERLLMRLRDPAFA